MISLKELTTIYAEIFVYFKKLRRFWQKLYAKSRTSTTVSYLSSSIFEKKKNTEVGKKSL